MYSNSRKFGTIIIIIIARSIELENLSEYRSSKFCCLGKYSSLAANEEFVSASTLVQDEEREKNEKLN